MMEETYSLLRQLPRSLILAVPQEFNDPSLIGCEASDFFDDFADESGAFGQVAFGAGDAGLVGDGCGVLEKRVMSAQRSFQRRRILF